MCEAAMRPSATFNKLIDLPCMMSALDPDGSRTVGRCSLNSVSEGHILFICSRWRVY